jgi:beta-galactosidase/beta-glucuronidase
MSVELSRDAAATTLQATLSRSGELAARVTYHFRSARFDAVLVLPEAEPWSPETLNLYDLAVELIVGDVTVDAIERVVEFRRFEARDGQLLLNGQPFYLLGALDQDWHPEEEYHPPNAEFLEERFANAKAIGVNTVRCHVKIPDPLYFDLADRLGLIVWLDMPYMEFLAPAIAKGASFRATRLNSASSRRWAALLFPCSPSMPRPPACSPRSAGRTAPRPRRTPESSSRRALQHRSAKS